MRWLTATLTSQECVRCSSRLAPLTANGLQSHRFEIDLEDNLCLLRLTLIAFPTHITRTAHHTTSPQVKLQSCKYPTSGSLSIVPLRMWSSLDVPSRRLLSSSQSAAPPTYHDILTAKGNPPSISVDHTYFVIRSGYLHRHVCLISIFTGCKHVHSHRQSRLWRAINSEAQGLVKDLQEESTREGGGTTHRPFERIHRSPKVFTSSPSSVIVKHACTWTEQEMPPI